MSKGRTNVSGIVVSSVAAMVVGAMLACSSAPPAPPAQAAAAATDVGLVTASEAECPTHLTVTGMIAAEERTDVSADTQGRVLAVMVERGARVKQGDALVRLDTRSAALGATEARANLEAARAQRRLAEEECKRSASLFEKGAITKSQYDREQTSCSAAMQQVAAADARTQMISKSVADGIVRAPFAGLVTARNVSPGMWVGPGVPLLSLVDDDPLRIDLSIPESAVRNVALGQTVELTVTSEPDKLFTAKIVRMSGEISKANRALVAEALFAPGTALLPGMFAEARVVVGQAPLPVVPAEALVRRGKSWRALVAVKGQLEERIVQRGPVLADGRVCVKLGLAKSDQIVGKITSTTVDGMRVKQ